MGMQELRRDPFERCHPVIEFAILDFADAGCPKSCPSGLTEGDAVPQAANSLALEQRIAQPRRQLQVLALGSECILGESNGMSVIGDLALMLPGALRKRIVFSPRLPDFVVERGSSEGFDRLGGHPVSGSGCPHAAAFSGYFAGAGRSATSLRGHGQLFQLEVRPQESDRPIGAGFAGNFGNIDARLAQRSPGLWPPSTRCHRAPRSA